jgi:hypothetical protein
MHCDVAIFVLFYGPDCHPKIPKKIQQTPFFCLSRPASPFSTNCSFINIMSKILLSTMQVVALEIERLQARRALCLREASEIQSTIKTLQKVNAKKEKKAEKKTVVIDQIHSQKEV